MARLKMQLPSTSPTAKLGARATVTEVIPVASSGSEVTVASSITPIHVPPSPVSCAIWSPYLRSCDPAARISSEQAMNSSQSVTTAYADGRLDGVRRRCHARRRHHGWRPRRPPQGAHADRDDGPASHTRTSLGPLRALSHLPPTSVARSPPALRPRNRSRRHWSDCRPFKGRSEPVGTAYAISPPEPTRSVEAPEPRSDPRYDAAHPPIMVLEPPSTWRSPSI